MANSSGKSLAVSGTQVPDENLNFWEVGQYKKAVDRIENGLKQCREMQMLLKDRAFIEETYFINLKEWAEKYDKVIRKGSSYQSLKEAWLMVVKEADLVADIHLGIRDKLLIDTHEKARDWKKDHFHHSFLTGCKELNDFNEEFQAAQRDWARDYKNVMSLKKAYFAACKETIQADMQEKNAKLDSATPDKLEKVRQNNERKVVAMLKLKDKYHQSFKALAVSKERYIEKMEKVFGKTQIFEINRIKAFKYLLELYQKHLDISKSPEYVKFQQDFKLAISKVSAEADCHWWSKKFGVGMPFKFPPFEEFDQSLLDSSPLSKTTQGRLKQDKGRTNPGWLGEASYFSASDRDREKPSSSTPAQSAAPPNSTSPTNDLTITTKWTIFDEDAESVEVKAAPSLPSYSSKSDSNLLFPNPPEIGKVRALYDYVGQDDDEISFVKGDIIAVLAEEDKLGWCEGRLENGNVGYYPSKYVENI